MRINSCWSGYFIYNSEKDGDVHQTQSPNKMPVICPSHPPSFPQQGIRQKGSTPKCAQWGQGVKGNIRRKPDHKRHRPRSKRQTPWILAPSRKHQVDHKIKHHLPPQYLTLIQTRIITSISLSFLFFIVIVIISAKSAPYTTYPPRELNILLHNRDSLRVDCAQVRIFK